MISDPENPYSPGITGRQHERRIELERTLATTPVLDYPEHSDRHRRTPTHPRTERFVNWCIDHQVGVSLALWALILAGFVVVWWTWLR